MVTLIKCRWVKSRFSDYLGDDLDRESSGVIAEHLGRCPHCSGYFETFRKTVQLCRRLPELEVPEELHQRIMERIRRTSGPPHFTMHLFVVKFRRHHAPPSPAGSRPELAGRAEDADTAGFWAPPVDVIEEGDFFYLEAFLPGCVRGELRVTAGARCVRIEGRNRLDAPPGSRYFRREMKSGLFYREIRLPGDIIPERTIASYRNCILGLRFFKKSTAAFRLEPCLGSNACRPPAGAGEKTGPGTGHAPGPGKRPGNCSPRRDGPAAVRTRRRGSPGRE